MGTHKHYPPVKWEWAPPPPPPPRSGLASEDEAPTTASRTTSPDPMVVPPPAPPAAADGPAHSRHDGRMATAQGLAAVPAAVDTPPTQRFTHAPESPTDAAPPATAPEEREPRTRTWHGGFRFEPITVGTPGAGSSVRSRLDPEIPHRPDTVLDGITVFDSPDPRRRGARPVAQLRAASVRGLSHRHGGTVRQDEYGFRQSADGRYLVAVVADGVSAGAQSHRAAVVAAQRGCEYLVGLLSEHRPEGLPWCEVVDGLTKEILLLGRKVLRSSAQPSDEDLRQIAKAMSTTALFAVVDLGSEGPSPVHLLPVGDTSAWVLRHGERWETPQPVKNEGADIATSAVRGLPEVRPVEHFPLLTTVAPGEVLLLMSDGVGDALLDGDNDFGDYLAATCATPPAALEFAAQVDFLRKSFDDDRTVVAIWPEERR